MMASKFMPVESSLSLSRTQTQGQQKKQLRTASQMYEKQFLQNMVKEMRKTVQHSGLTKPSFAQKLFTQQLDEQYVEAWTQRGGIGLADLIYDQINQRFFKTQPHKPQGPLPLNSPKVLPFKKKESLPIEPLKSTNEEQNKLGYLFHLDQLFLDKNKMHITSPWEGTVTHIISSAEGRQTFKINHGEGLKSVISFRGQKALQPGDGIEMGATLGQLSPSAQGLTWLMES